ncbi:unnamed protein product, partial [Didymodactylos carnosus]
MTAAVEINETAAEMELKFSVFFKV